ncbi:MAG: Lrp/AsnC family transcriptional regulator, partial [Microbacterium arborescens]
MRSIAADVGMSAPAVAERIARLERGHVIQRHTIELDWAALGHPMLVVMPMRLAGDADVGQRALGAPRDRCDDRGPHARRRMG